MADSMASDTAEDSTGQKEERCKSVALGRAVFRMS